MLIALFRHAVLAKSSTITIATMIRVLLQRRDVQAADVLQVGPAARARAPSNVHGGRTGIEMELNARQTGGGGGNGLLSVEVPTGGRGRLNSVNQSLDAQLSAELENIVRKEQQAGFVTESDLRCVRVDAVDDCHPHLFPASSAAS